MANEIVKVEKIICEDSLLLDRYSQLETQYESDIKRLSFIVESEDINNNYIETKCPFCNNKLNHEKASSYVDGAIAELHKSVNNINSLNEVRDELIDKIIANKRILNDLKDKKKNWKKKLFYTMLNLI